MKAKVDDYDPLGKRTATKTGHTSKLREEIEKLQGKIDALEIEKQNYETSAAACEAKAVMLSRKLEELREQMMDDEDNMDDVPKL